jgi:hypothetical protein
MTTTGACPQVPQEYVTCFVAAPVEQDTVVLPTAASDTLLDLTLLPQWCLSVLGSVVVTVDAGDTAEVTVRVFDVSDGSDPDPLTNNIDEVILRETNFTGEAGPVTLTPTLVTQLRRGKYLVRVALTQAPDGLDLQLNAQLTIRPVYILDA